ncbi:hypothetical protein AB0F13_05665 [Streptomyces sp. NPDC026206]|uniref:hypothetical protein n=1 Tax=Streptomyces sp. NPDC026206 TaxID=3157089 RepID=UPI0033CCCDF0
MSEHKSPPEPEPQVRACPWCHGSGFLTHALAYCPGTDPFKGPTETVHRAGQCPHCRGSGAYDSALDTTLDQARGEEPPPP